MSFNSIATADIQAGKPVKQELMQKIKDNDDYLYSQIDSLSAHSVPNGSFEIDSDGDGIPDMWTRSLFSGGSGAFDTTTPAHGGKAYKITGAGSGGGTLTSDYLPAAGGRRIFLSWILWCSANNVPAKVEALFYDKDKAYISAYTIMNEVASMPTVATPYVGQFLPTASTRFVKIRLTGCTTGTGTTYFDKVSIDNTNRFVYGVICSANEVGIVGGAYADAVSMTLTLPFRTNLGLMLKFLGEGRGGDVSTYVLVRFRIGAYYSNEEWQENVIASTGTTYRLKKFQLVFSPDFTTMDWTLICQVARYAGTAIMYGRKSLAASELTIIEPS